MSSNQITIHGVFLSIFNVGVLIVGQPGSGKSELTLALIDRGHQLIADDAPQFTCNDGKTLIGCCPKLLQDFLQVRNLGVLNIRKVFGDHAVKPNNKLQLIITLGEDVKVDNHLSNKQIPTINISTKQPVLVEIAVRNFLLQQQGYDANLDFANQQQQLLEQETT